jgi:signal transduction histidine kinase
VDELDTTIQQIRTSIFHLQQLSAVNARRGLRSRLLDLTGEAAAALGFDPALRFSGVLDTVPEAIADDLEAVLREALSNVTRHARARSVEVSMERTAGGLTLTVRDDGVGLGTASRRSGLANLRARAERHGGTLTLEPVVPSGTLLRWSVPVA